MDIKVPTEMKQALRQCSYAVFRMYDGNSIVQCVKQHNNGKTMVDLWDVEFPVKTICGRDDIWGVCVMNNYWGQPSTLTTLVKLLTNSYELQLKWYRNAGTCDSMKDHGMGMDRLYFEMINKKTSRMDSYLFADMFYHNKNYREIKHDSELLGSERTQLQYVRDHTEISEEL